jgi:transcriptional regulator with XRE-family HTH domain
MKTNHNIEFGKRVKLLRNNINLSQEQFALKCNIDRAYMGCIERGEKSPTLNTIQKIADGLGISLKELFNY